jgi:hypothetical protein
MEIPLEKIYTMNLLSSLQETVKEPQLKKRMLIGFILALSFISVFLFIPKINPKPEWSIYWKLRPMLITPLGGAAAGFVFHYFMSLIKYNHINKWLGYILAIVISFMAFWISVILGLDGTLWD